MIKKVISYLIVTFSLFGCATFSKKESFKNQINLDNNNISKLNGIYIGACSKSISGFTILDENSMTKYSLKTNTLFYTLKTNSPHYYYKDIIFDDNYVVKVEIINSKKISFKLFNNNQIVDNLVLDYIIKKNGYVYLKNNNFKAKMIPGLLGNFQANRIRIGLNDRNNLILNHSFFIYGAFLFIIGDMKSENFAAEYFRKS